MSSSAEDAFDACFLQKQTVTLSDSEAQVTLLAPALVTDGQLFLAQLQLPAICDDPRIVWDNAVLHPFEVYQNHYHVLLPVRLGRKPEAAATLTVVCGSASDSPQAAFNIMIDAGLYPASRLSVNPKFTAPPPMRVVQETARMNKAIAEGIEARLWHEPFIKPVKGAETSPFGVRRLFNGQLKSRHTGEDFDGRIGDVIVAANNGVVALVADDFFYVGNAVLIDHGGDIFTMYFHLSEVLVKTGDTISRGAPIGKLGRTGRVTGPHLHFATKVAGMYVNPADLLHYHPQVLLENLAVAMEPSIISR